MPLQQELKTLRATFRDLKVSVLGKPEKIPCRIEMELRPVVWRPGLYSIIYVTTGRAVNQRCYTRNMAEEKLRIMFVEQLTPWTEVKPERVK